MFKMLINNKLQFYNIFLHVNIHTAHFLYIPENAISQKKFQKKFKKKYGINAQYNTDSVFLLKITIILYSYQYML